MKRKIIGCVMALLCLFMGILLPVSAITPLETQRECGLTIHYTADGQAFPGVEVSLYRVSETLPDGTYDKIAPFADYPVSIYDITTQTGWKQVAATLMGYVVADGITPIVTATADKSGTVSFTGLTTGLYLVGGVTAQVEKASWEFAPFTLYLPAVEEDGYVYDVAAKPKGSQSKPIPGGTRYKLLKLWKDAGHTDARPTTVSVEISKDGRLWKTVSLTEENNWAYAWDDPEGVASWSVAERNVPDSYTVLTQQEDTTFVITNTWKDPDQPDTPDDPDDPDKPDDPDDPDQPDDPDDPDDPDQPDDPDKPDDPDDPDDPDQPDDPDKPDDPDTPDKPDTPQTGDTEPLWLYVLLMVFSGMALMILGVGGMRGQKNGKTK